MSIIDTTLTNTVLIPTMDGLVSGNPLPETTVGERVQKYNKNFETEQKTESTQFELYIISGGKSVPAGKCEQVQGLVVKRAVEERRSGGNGDYVAKLPGPLTFSSVLLTHLYCDNDLFMDWMVNGSDRGGAYKADIELKIGPGPGKASMIYTLRDAFPVEWHLGTLSVNTGGLITEITTRDTVQYTINGDQLMVENVRIAYGRLDYKRG